MARGPCRGDDVAGTGRVLIQHRPVAAPGDTDGGGRVDRCVAPGSRLFNGCGVDHVPRDDVEHRQIDIPAAENVARLVGVADQHTDVMAPIEQGGNGVRADESACPGQEYAHGPIQWA